MKKIILSVTLLCIVCFLFGSCANGNSTISQADSGEPVSDVMSNKESSVDPESTAPQASAVITLSHMKDLTGAEKNSKKLTRAALERYAGQNVKYRVRFVLPDWEDEGTKDEYNHCYSQLMRGAFGTVYRLDAESTTGIQYADLTEEALREILSYEKADVKLIDEFPGPIELLTIGELPPNVELPADIPSVITASHMKELTGLSTVDLEQIALNLYAGQDVKYRVQFHMSYWEDDAVKDEFYQKLRSGAFGTVYYATIMLGLVGYPEYKYAEVTEEVLREILSYEMTSVKLIDEFPEAIELYTIGEMPPIAELPADIPSVITASHMEELTGLYAVNMEQVALNLYAGKNVKYRVSFYMSYWEEDAVKDEFYQKLRSGSFGTAYIWDDDIPSYVGCPQYLYAEVTEEALREILSYEMATVDLIDEFPEGIELYAGDDVPQAPAVVTRSHMAEKVGEDADLVAEALKLYAGQDTKYCVMVTAEGKAEFESFMELAAELYRAQYHCEVWPGCSDGSIMGGYGDYLEDYQNDLYGTFYIDKDMKDWYWQHKDDAWLSPLYAELPEAALRAVLECGGVSVQLFDAFPENVAEIGVSVAA